MKQPRRAKHAANKKSSSAENTQKTPKLKRKRYFRIFFSVVLVIAVIAGICIGCDFSTNDDITDDNVLAPVDIKEGKINVLLLGVDIEGLRTDAMMVASYDISENKVNLLSIPRDTRMYIGTKYQKINAAHAIGGMKGKIAGPEGSVEAVTRLTAIPINYYIEFSFGAIDNFINALGGVDFDVPDVEGKGRGMNYDDPVQSLHIHLKPGMQHLNGNQVQQLLRYRKSNTKGLGYPEGDRGRVSMQQSFIRALVDQKFTVSNLSKIPDIITSIKEGIKTNMSIVDMTKYMKYLKDFSSENITAYQLPGEGNGTDYGASYWICNLEETKELIQNVFGYDASNITIDSPDGSSKSKDKKTSEKSSSKDSSDSSSKTSKATSAPKKQTEDIPDNSDDEDYSNNSARITNPPLPTKAAVISKPKDEDKDDEDNTDEKNPSQVSDDEDEKNTDTKNHDTSNSSSDTNAESNKKSETSDNPDNSKGSETSDNSSKKPVSVKTSSDNKSNDNTKNDDDAENVSKKSDSSEKSDISAAGSSKDSEQPDKPDNNKTSDNSSETAKNITDKDIISLD